MKFSQDSSSQTSHCIYFLDVLEREEISLLGRTLEIEHSWGVALVLWGKWLGHDLMAILCHQRMAVLHVGTAEHLITWGKGGVRDGRLIEVEVRLVNSISGSCVVPSKTDRQMGLGQSLIHIHWCFMRDRENFPSTVIDKDTLTLWNSPTCVICVTFSQIAPSSPFHYSIPLTLSHKCQSCGAHIGGTRGACGV